MNGATKPARGGAGHRIAGDRHESGITRVDEGRWQHRVGRLGTDAVVDFIFGVEHDAKLPSHEGSNRLFKNCDSVVGIAAILRPVDLVPHHSPHIFGSHFIIFTDAKIEHASLGMVGEGLTFGAFDQFKLIDLVALAVLRTANPGGEAILKPRVTIVCLD